MKINGKNVPNEYNQRYNDLISRTNKNLVVDTTQRTRKKAKKPKTAKSKPKPTKRDLYRYVIRSLALYFGKDGDSPEEIAWQNDRMNELLAKSPSATWWRTVTPQQTQYFTSHPQSAADLDPPAYAYRTPDNLPSLMSYGMGDPSSAPLAATGSLKNGYFSDDALTWAAFKFKLPEPAGYSIEYPLLVRVSLAIRAICDKRGSRPMFSYRFRITPCADEPDLANWNVPPLTASLTGYYRYKPPLGVAPYYDASLTRLDYIVPFRDEIAYNKTWFVVEVSPRAMMGHGNNNNAAVAITATPNIRMLTPKPTIYAWERPCFHMGGSIIRALNDNMTSWVDIDITPIVLPEFATREQVGGRDEFGDMWIVFWRTGDLHRIADDVPNRWFGNSYQYIFWIRDDRVPSGNGTLYSKVQTLNNPGEALYSVSHKSLCLDLVTQHAKGSNASTHVLLSDHSWTSQSIGARKCIDRSLDLVDSVAWSHANHVQDATGQWWRLPNAFGQQRDPCTWLQPDTLLGQVKLGNPVPRTGKAWASYRGICYRSGNPEPDDYRCVTWSGGVVSFSLPWADPYKWIGTIAK